MSTMAFCGFGNVWAKNPHVSERVSHRFFWKFKDDGRKGYLMNNIFSCMLTIW